MPNRRHAGLGGTCRALHADKGRAYAGRRWRGRSRETNTGWRIDYFIVSERLRSRIQNADIWSEVHGSDHCPVVLELSEE